MYPVTGAVAALFEAENRQVLRITGRDKNGTVVAITDENVMMNGFGIDRYSCIGDKLEVGTAIAAELVLKLNNKTGLYDGIVFEGTELFVEVGVADWSQANPTVHWIPCGFFTSDEQPRRLTTISLKALDRMARFDAVQPTLLPWTDGNGTPIEDGNGNIIYFNALLPFPMTIAQTVSRMCIICNVPFTQDISGLPNANVIISSMPVTQQEASYRTLLQWCAGVMGCCAYIDWNGELRLQWYTAAGYTSTLSKRFKSDLFENDLTITGVTYVNTQNQKFVAGTDAYAVEITGNLFLDTGTAAKLAAINGAIGGYTYRPFSASVLPAPWLFPLDVIVFTDKDGVNHNCAVTNVNFGLNGSTELAGKGLTAQLNKYSAVGGLTPAQAQALMVTARQAQEALQNLDNSLTQQEIFDRLTDGGLEQGLALEATMPSLGAAGEKKLYLNLDYARFGKLVADFIQGGTLTLGGLDNADGVLRVLDADGTEIGTWDNAGITLNKGAIAGPSVTLGGAGNADGVLRVLDANGYEIGLWNNSGIILSKGSIRMPYSNGAIGDYTGINSDGYPFVVRYTHNGVPRRATISSYFFEQRDLDTNNYSDLSSTYLVINRQDGEQPFVRLRTLNLGYEVYLRDTGLTVSKLDGTAWSSVSADSIQTKGNATIYGDFAVTGTKNRIVHTDQYGDRLLYCYETPSPMFGDVGEGVIGGDRLCYVALDAVFAQTIGDGAYQVFLQKYGAGDCWVKERLGGYFIVEGTPGMAFGWEIKAKQRDYEQRRLDRNDGRFSVPAQQYGAEAAQYIEELMNGRVLA